MAISVFPEDSELIELFNKTPDFISFDDRPWNDNNIIFTYTDGEGSGYCEINSWQAKLQLIAIREKEERIKLDIRCINELIVRSSKTRASLYVITRHSGFTVLIIIDFRPVIAISCSTYYAE